MLNIHELERKWFRYKIKSYIPHTVIFLSSLLIIILLYALLNSNYFKHQDLGIEDSLKQKETISALSDKNYTQEIIQTDSVALNKKLDVPVETPVITQIAPAEQKLFIAPSMNFIKNIQHDDTSYNQREPYVNRPSMPSTKIELPHQAPPVHEYIEETVLAEPIQIEEKSVEEEEHKVNSISIKRQNEYSDIQEIIKRFKKNNNPALSLFIAKKYYELGEYRNAYNYSLITNELNKDIEASWIIFAQSLVKLNEKDQAIKILQEYIKHSNSNRANLLLDEILSGKFK